MWIQKFKLKLRPHPARPFEEFYDWKEKNAQKVYSPCKGKDVEEA